MLKASLFFVFVLEMMIASSLLFRNANVSKENVFDKKVRRFLPVDSENICIRARPGVETAAFLCGSSIFSEAKLAIEKASKDRREHSVTFGKGADGHITTSAMADGDISKGEVNSDWPGSFADLHNHNNNQPPSAGDLYYLIKINKKHDGYCTRFVLTSAGDLHALYLYDQKLANDFVRRYSMEQSPGFSPRFPEPIFDEYDQVSIYFEGNGDSHVIAQERAMSLMLSKYHTGVALLKQDNQGSFVVIQTEEVVDKKRKTYVVKNCQ